MVSRDKKIRVKKSNIIKIIPTEALRGSDMPCFKTFRDDPR